MRLENNFPVDRGNIVINYLSTATIRINSINDRQKIPRMQIEMMNNVRVSRNLPRSLVETAISNRNEEAISFLMRLGADVSLANNFENLSPQMKAQIEAHNSFVRTLPSATSDVTKTSEVMRPHYSTTDSRIVR